MSEKVQKFITIKQTCTECQKEFYKKTKIVDVPVDFKLSDIKSQLNKPDNACPNCKAIVEPKFSFYHEENIN